jgi:phosphonate degradation associated HDIG domain protein
MHGPTKGAGVTDPVDEVLQLFADRGDGHFGEAVDQRRHALQCAALARSAGAPDPLVAAALLHDIGHLLSDTGDTPATRDDRHEAVGARWLASRFGPGVAGPVALHVLAKRYRCAVDSSYLDALSPASIETLRLQGGPLDAAGVARFSSHPGADQALLLRVWDEAAKDPDADTEPIDAFVRCLRDTVTRR